MAASRPSRFKSDIRIKPEKARVKEPETRMCEAPGCIGPGNCRVSRDIFCDEHRGPGPADMAYLPHVQRNAAEVSGKASPVCARVVGGVPGARP